MAYIAPPSPCALNNLPISSAATVPLALRRLLYELLLTAGRARGSAHGGRRPRPRFSRDSHIAGHLVWALLLSHRSLSPGSGPTHRLQPQVQPLARTTLPGPFRTTTRRPGRYCSPGSCPASRCRRGPRWLENPAPWCARSKTYPIPRNGGTPESLKLGKECRRRPAPPCCVNSK